MEPNVDVQKVGGEKPSLFGMITSPRLQFERMKTSSSVWGALIILAVLGGIVSIINNYINFNSPQLQAVMENEQAAMFKNITIGTSFFTGMLGVAMGFMFAAAVYKVIMMFIGNDTPYQKLLSITVYTGIITCIGLLINGVLAIVFGGDGTVKYTSLGPLFEKGTVAFGIGSTIDIFVIWALVVTGLGLHITAGLSKKQATIFVVVFFIISLAFGAVVGLVSGLFPKA
ncbi:Yip1 family protein [Bacillus cereus group sp. BfR-BA-01380]|uniref:Yip1 family protein n=1 Tax=Bacillus cereus group sp. BfR-BA-01380 TaxID=2920324 RepID=UPI001F56A96D|nr:Yip1 family protein [Bacillus cereus group sp. BfR-BA-01380]